MARADTADTGKTLFDYYSQCITASEQDFIHGKMPVNETAVDRRRFLLEFWILCWFAIDFAVWQFVSEDDHHEIMESFVLAAREKLEGSLQAGELERLELRRNARLLKYATTTQDHYGNYLQELGRVFAKNCESESNFLVAMTGIVGFKTTKEGAVRILEPRFGDDSAGD